VHSLEPELLRSEQARRVWLGALGLDAETRAALDALRYRRPMGAGGDHPALGAEPARDAAERSRALDLVRTAVALIDDRPAKPGVAAAPEDPLASAIAIGDAICAEAFPGPDWHGVAWRPNAGIRVVHVVGLDLLSGQAGLALLLAALCRRTGLERFTRVATSVLTRTASLADRLTGGGGHGGVGGIGYALARCGAWLGRPDWVELAKRILARAAIGPSWDVVEGTAGVLLASLAVGPADPTIVVGLRTAWASGLPRPPYVPGGLPPWLADVDGAAAYVLHRCGAPVPARAGGELLWRLGVDPEAAGAALDRLEGPPGDLLDDLELALTAHDAGGPPRLAEIARARADALLARHGRTGRWFPATSVVERHNLSALTGIAAVAYALLRALDPGALPSLRRME
jgi:hypothetical protein